MQYGHRPLHPEAEDPSHRSSSQAPVPGFRFACHLGSPQRWIEAGFHKARLPLAGACPLDKAKAPPPRYSPESLRRCAFLAPAPLRKSSVSIQDAPARHGFGRHCSADDQMAHGAHLWGRCAGMSRQGGLQALRDWETEAHSPKNQARNHRTTPYKKWQGPSPDGAFLADQKSGQAKPRIARKPCEIHGSLHSQQTFHANTHLAILISPRCFSIQSADRISGAETGSRASIRGVSDRRN